MLSPGGQRAIPSQAQAAALGLKIATYPTGMLSPAIAGMQAGLAAMAAGEAAAASALPVAALRKVLGYDDYDSRARPYLSED